MPLIDEIEFEVRGVLSGDGVAIESYAGAGILRSQTDSDDALEFLRSDGFDCVGDEGFPIAHADEDRQLERLRKLGGLKKSPAG